MGTAPQGELILRRADAADADAVYAVGAACFSDAWRAETVVRDMAGAHSLYLAAEKDGSLLGYACYWFVMDEAQLVNIGVSPAVRRQGIARRLLEAGISAAKERGMASMYLEVRVSNIPAQTLYRSYGFAVKALRKAVYEKPVEDGYIMAVSLEAVPGAAAFHTP